MTENKLKIFENIQNKFKNRENHIRKIVLWIDEDKDFKNIFDEINIENTKKIELNQNNQFYVKYILFHEDAKSDYLVYADYKVENDDFVIDICFHSELFRADMPSLILLELKTQNTPENNNYEIIKSKMKFFKTKKSEILKNYDIDYSLKNNLYHGILYAIIDLKTPDFEQFIIKLLSNGLEETNEHYKKILYYLEKEEFWQIIENYFGYTGEKTLIKFTSFLFITSLSFSIDKNKLSKYDEYISKNNTSNILVFLDHWKSRKDITSFQNISKSVEEYLELNDTFQNYDIEIIKETDLFEICDKLIIKKIISLLNSNINKYDYFKNIINLRRTSAWNDNFFSFYKSLYYYIEMLEFKEKHSNEFNFNSFEDGFKKYETIYYKMDFYYRKFYYYYDKKRNSDLLKLLSDNVENIYTQWYIPTLDNAWVEKLNEEINDINKIKINPQWTFFNNIELSKVKTVVIISDALRYEIAKEFQEKLNKETRSSTELKTRLGIMPSITKLGMTALLPHNNKIIINDDFKVMINEIYTDDIEKRNNILKKSNETNIALKYEEFMQKTTEEKQEIKKENDLIYIYHNKIDSTGDTPSSEDNVFNSAEETINDLFNIAKSLLNIGITNIYFTTDHGFLYQRSNINSYDTMQKYKIDAICYKRRYIITKENKDLEGLIKLNLDYINNEKYYAYFPKGNIRFKTQGYGEKFVHGGISLQEIVIPELLFKPIKSTSKYSESYEVKNVDLLLIGENRRITNTYFSLEFYQNKPIGEKYISADFEIMMIDEKNKEISNIITIVANSNEEENKKRTYKVQFTLKNNTYTKNKNYYLIIKNKTKKIISHKEKFIIDILFDNDFGF